MPARMWNDNVEQCEKCGRYYPREQLHLVACEGVWCEGCELKMLEGENKMPTSDEILAAIPSTEPATFSEFLNALPDTPEKGDRQAWADLFSQLRTLENAGLVEVERANKGGSIESLMLTEDGADRVRRNGYARKLE